MTDRQQQTTPPSASAAAAAPATGLTPSNAAASPLRSSPTSPPQPQPFAIVRLAAAIRSNSNRIAAAELQATGQAEYATHHQCDLALRFIANYAAHNAGGNIESLAYVMAARQSGTDEAAATFVVDGTRTRSLFEVFTSVAVHLRVGHAVTVRLDAERSYLKVSGVVVLVYRICNLFE